MFDKLYIDDNVILSASDIDKIKLILSGIDVFICDDYKRLERDDYNNSVFVGKTLCFLENARLHGCGVIAVIDDLVQDELFSYKYAVDSVFAIDCKYLEMIYARLHDIQLIICHTKRFTIKEMSVEDAKIFYEVASKNQNLFAEDLGFIVKEMDFVRYSTMIDELAAAYVDTVYDLYGYGMWSLYLNESKADNLVGFVGIYDFTIDSETYSGISYYIDSTYRGNSLACDAVQEVIKYCKNTLNINEIYCLIEEDNSSSIRVAQKCGFTFVKKVRENNYLLYLRKL